MINSKKLMALRKSKKKRAAKRLREVKVFGIYRHIEMNFFENIYQHYVPIHTFLDKFVTYFQFNNQYNFLEFEQELETAPKKEFLRNLKLITDIFCDL